ncbi:type VI secretion system-associated protein TagO [Oricola thermophila]|uniref:Type VI secretion system-associated protein TagO n=1 Tax=Oricola thermophila TaxID=2742145 RepID=A0A6N1VH13_9HYPH|nr:type VI secretion system-associated protein TagO [Oricola thermophila]QKV20190.1 hypothetical protein HTY61_17910 [Oricola thermophila]
MLIAIAFLLLAALNARAKEQCISIANDLDRLACYDREAGRTPKRERITPAIENWDVTKETSKLTDHVNVFLSVKSQGVVNCGWNNGDHIRLLVRCVENTTALIFHTGCHMTSSDYNDYGNITYRLDSDKAQTVRGYESTNNRSLGLWTGSRSIPVIKQMFGKSVMVVRMTPFGENPFTATFNITGLEEAIAPLREACHW